MKKTITSSILSILIAFSINAQIFQTLQDDLPGGELSTDAILYFKFTLTEVDTAVFYNVAFHLAPVDTIRDFGDYACQIRARQNLGYFDVRDQGGPGNQMAIDTVYYEFNKAYHCWVNIKFGTPSQYDVYLLADGDAIENLSTIAENAKFRNDLQLLTIWSVLCFDAASDSMGTMEISDLKYVENIEVPTPVIKVKLENNSSTSLLCYPNPANDFLAVNYSIDYPSQIQFIIYDMNGKEFKHMDMGSQIVGKHSIEIDVRDLDKGVYFGQLSTENELVTTKIIIN